MDRVYVGNLPPDIRIKDIDDFFRPFGKLFYIDVNHQANPVYAYVQFDSPRNAFNAVKARHGYDYEGYTLQLRLVENEVRKRRDASPPPPPPVFNNRGSGYSQSSFGNSNSNRGGGNYSSSSMFPSTYQANSNSQWSNTNRSQQNMMDYQSNNRSNMSQQSNIQMESYSGRSNMPQQFSNSNRSNMSQQNMNYSSSNRLNMPQQNMNYSSSNISNMSQQNMNYSNTNRSNMSQQQQNMNSMNNSNNSSWNSGNNNMNNWNNSNNVNMGNWSSNNNNMGNWNSGNNNMDNWSSGNNNMGNWSSANNNMGNWSSGNNNMDNWSNGNTNMGNTGWISNNTTTGFGGDNFNNNNNNPPSNFIYNSNNDPYANQTFEDNFTQGLSNNGRKWFNSYIRKGFSPRIARKKAMDKKRVLYPRDGPMPAIMPDSNDPTNAALETIGNTIMSFLSGNQADNFNNSNQLVPWTGGNSQDTSRASSSRAGMKRENPHNRVSREAYAKSKSILSSLKRKRVLTSKDSLFKKYHLQIVRDYEDFEKKIQAKKGVAGTAPPSSTTKLNAGNTRQIASTSAKGKAIEEMSQKYRQKKKKLLLEGRRLNDKSTFTGGAYKRRVGSLMKDYGFLAVEAKALATHSSEKLKPFLDLKAALDKAEGRINPKLTPEKLPKHPKLSEEMYKSDVDYVKSYEQYKVKNLSHRIKRNIAFYIARVHQYEKNHNLPLTFSKYTKLLPAPKLDTIPKPNERRRKRNAAKKTAAAAGKSKSTSASTTKVEEKKNNKGNTKEKKEITDDNVNTEAMQQEDDGGNENNEDITEEHEEEYEDADENPEQNEE